MFDFDYITKEDIKEHNPNCPEILEKKGKIIIVFDDMIADMLSIKKLNPIVTELFIRGRKLKVSLVFIAQSYFADIYTRFNTLFCYENSKQNITSTNCI